MAIVRRTDLLGIHPAEISRHLASKGLASTIREEVDAYEIACEADEGTITASLSDLTATMTREEWEADEAESARRGLDLERYRGLVGELVGLRQYHDIATPTNPQSVAAIKAIIRVLRALIRD